MTKYRTDYCPVCNREISEAELAHIKASNRRWDHEVDCLGWVKERDPETERHPSYYAGWEKRREELEVVASAAQALMTLHDDKLIT